MPARTLLPRLAFVVALVVLGWAGGGFVGGRLPGEGAMGWDRLASALGGMGVGIAAGLAVGVLLARRLAARLLWLAAAAAIGATALILAQA